MAEVVLFHHALGLTAGVVAFADRLRAAGHRVNVPDLYEGATFASIDDGVAHAEQIGFGTVVERGVAAAAGMPDRVVYAGFSLGVMPAQRLAQTRDGALAAILYHSAVPAAEFGAAWPDGVALQVHVNDRDPWGDQDVAEELVAQAAGAELFTYSGSAHLFTDSSLEEYDPVSTQLVLGRTLSLLSRWPCHGSGIDREGSVSRHRFARMRACRRRRPRRPSEVPHAPVAPRRRRPDRFPGRRRTGVG